jgi:hypothetical protein
MSSLKLLSLQSIVDSRGQLTVIQDFLPFSVRRIFWITQADGQVRGGHRHHVTRQALIAVTGVVTVFLDNGSESKSILLNRSDQCLIVEPEDWHTMTFGAGSVLLVLASHQYNPNDYIQERY